MARSSDTTDSVIAFSRVSEMRWRTCVQARSCVQDGWAYVCGRTSYPLLYGHYLVSDPPQLHVHTPAQSDGYKIGECGGAKILSDRSNRSGFCESGNGSQINTGKLWLRNMVLGVDTVINASNRGEEGYDLSKRGYRLEAKRSIHMFDSKIAQSQMAMDVLEQNSGLCVTSELVPSEARKLGGAFPLKEAGLGSEVPDLVSTGLEAAAESSEKRRQVESADEYSSQSIDLESPVESPKNTASEESGSAEEPECASLETGGIEGEGEGEDLPFRLEVATEAAMFRTKKDLASTPEGRAMILKAEAAGEKLWSPVADENLRLLLRLGGTRKHLLHIYGRHSNLYTEDATSSLLASARLFHEFELSVFLLVKLIYGWGLTATRRVMLLNEPLKPRENLLFLRDVVGVTKNLQPMILACPNVLINSTEKMAQNIAVLNELNIPCGPALYARYPRLLLMKTETLRDRIKTLYDIVEEAGISAHEVLQKRPNMCSVSSDLIRENIRILIDKFGREGCIEIVNRYPTVLMLKATNFVPTLAFLEQMVGKRALQEVREFPLLLGFSLEGRIKPRLQLLRDLETCNLRSVIVPANSEFERKFKVSLPLELPRRHEWL